MPQSSVIVGALLVGWLVFIILRGELDKYLAVLFTSHPSSAPAAPKTPPVAVNQGSTTGVTLGGSLPIIYNGGGGSDPLGTGGGWPPIDTGSWWDLGTGDVAV
jgi:hypothetical protein